MPRHPPESSPAGCGVQRGPRCDNAATQPGGPLITTPFHQSPPDTVIEFDADQPIRINILTDQDCQDLPRVGEIIKTVISDDQTMQVQECLAAVKQYNSGEPPRRGNIVGDLEALAAHVKEWCPPGFAPQLDKAEE